MDADPTGCAAIQKWRRGLRQPAILGKQRSEWSRTERMWEPDRSQESKGSGEQRDQKSERSPKSPGAIEDGGPSLFLHQIIDFASVHFALAPEPCTACILAASTHPLYHTVALDSGSEDRYVHTLPRFEMLLS